MNRRGEPAWRVRANIHTKANVCWYREGCGTGNDFIVPGKVTSETGEINPRSLRVKVDLLFEDGSPAPTIGCEYHAAPVIQPDGSFEIRAAIQDVSKNNQNKAFCFCVEIVDATASPNAHHAVAFSEALFVRSKPPKKRAAKQANKQTVQESESPAPPALTTLSFTTAAAAAASTFSRKRPFAAISPSGGSSTDSDDEGVSVAALQAEVAAASNAAQVAMNAAKAVRRKCTEEIAAKRRKISRLVEEVKQLEKLLDANEEDNLDNASGVPAKELPQTEDVSDKVHHF